MTSRTEFKNELATAIDAAMIQRAKDAFERVGIPWLEPTELQIVDMHLAREYILDAIMPLISCDNCGRGFVPKCSGQCDNDE